MAERTKTSSSTAPASRPVRMKLFATWEVDRTPSNCIPRLCRLKLTRLVMLSPLGPELTSISLAVKMQRSKRTLRSNEMSVPPGGMLSTELDLEFDLQYPHFLKRDGNKLLVLLQRRKRYKNRTMLGYKTLAVGAINMAQVLQKQMDLELELVSDKAEKYGDHALARVNVVALCSQPVDQDKRLMSDANERLCQEFSDEEEESSSEAEAEGSDSEPTLEMHRRKSRAKMPGNARQRNLKQKFISLLKRFRVSEELEHDQEEIGQKLSGGDMEIEELFDELEDLSDSGPDMDTMSVNSTPKPSLRPYFNSSRRLLAPPNTGYDSITLPGEEIGAGGPAAAVAAAAASVQVTGQLCTPGHHHQPTERSRVGHTTPERGVDRQSDDSSRRADSDSHPDNWTDHEANDPTASGGHQAGGGGPGLAGSPPKSAANEQQQQQQAQAAGLRDKAEQQADRKSRLFARDRSNPGANKIKKHSLSVDLKPAGEPSISAEPRKALVEQLARVLPDDVLPDSVALVSLSDPGGAVLAARLQERNLRVLTTASPADVRATFTCLIARLQKYCNSCAKPPTPIKVVVAGGDGFVNTVLRHYVEMLSFRPPDWQGHLRFHVVPLGTNGLARYLGSLDPTYALLFGDEWRELAEREGGPGGEGAAVRVAEYLAGSASTLPLPIAEAMVTYRETDDSSQTFVPFINDVRVGCHESSASASVDLEEGGAGGGLGATSSGSPPSVPAAASLPVAGAAPGRLTPPSSPNVGQPREAWEPVELQLDYWGRQPTSLGEKGKNSLRQAFRLLHVQRLSPPGEPPGQSLYMNYTTKEKKQKIIRLGKKKEKEKENEPKSQQVDGVTRLICSAKTHNIPLRVSIDGTEWYGVKFFQLSAQWQTHIKTFPVAMLAYNNSLQSPNYS